MFELHTGNESKSKFCSSIGANSKVITPLFPSFKTELYNWVVGVFRAQNNKSKNLYLLLLDQCNWRTRNSTMHTLGNCPQCAVRSEQENTEIYKHLLLRENYMGKVLVKFKNTGSVSSHELALH
jgi:hypothetical protein